MQNTEAPIESLKPATQGFQFSGHLLDKPIWQRFRRNVSISVIGSGLGLAVKLGQTALLTRILKIEDYGRVLIVLNLFVFLDSFFGLRVSDVMFRFFPALKEDGNERSVQGLLLVCLGLCLTAALIIYGGVFILSPWVADRFYPNLELTPLFRIYGFTILISCFSGFYEPILRLHDRFTALVAPQLLGGIATLVILGFYFATNAPSSFSANGSPNLRPIIFAFAVGTLVQSTPPLIKALLLVRPFLSNIRFKEAARALNAHRRALAACLFNSNLSGYLKFAISPGDVFLLGLFSTPTQLAWYGLARQLTAPLGFLQANIQTAVTPEITSLVAARRWAQMKRLMTRYMFVVFGAGSVLLISLIWLGHLLVVSFLRPEYLATLPVFYLLAVAAWLMLAFLAFRPLALSLDLLRWPNLVLLASTTLVLIFIVAGRLNALTMAYIQLADVLILRSLFSYLVWMRLKRVADQA